jgi:hypothetical protein
MLQRRVLLCASVLLAAAAPSRAAGPPVDAEFFEKKVRPVLAEHCLKCHGPQKQKGGLRLDSRPALLRGGDSGPAVDPGAAARSRLVEAIGYAGELRMPPRGKLPAEAVADLTAWVEAGLPWPAGPTAPATAGSPATPDFTERRKHWCWQPVRPVTPPAVRDTAWPLNPIDRFVLAKLEAAGVAPAPPADRRTLLRRVTFDLTGLPPTPEEIDAFLADRSPEAYSKAVDRLLASPAYGERWARHWLDLVRYAETAGHEFDYDIPDAWRYRDYVIRALNADLPYDRFVTEQVAGDLLPEPRRDPDGTNGSVLGTGFWYLHEAVHSPVDVRADQANRLDNQIDVFGKTFLGLTLACARCHDHKFDPVAQKDYYALAGYLESSRQERAFLDDPAPRRAVLRQMADLKARADALAVRTTADRLLAGLDAAERPPATAAPDRAVVFADFRTGGYADWFVTGEAFGDRPARPGDVCGFPDERGLVRRVSPGAADSGRLSERLAGELRSRTFRIGSKKILFRVAGRGGRVNLIVDGYQHIRDPIYGGLKIDVNHGDGFRWAVMDVGMWLGHTAYVELLDEGPGWLAVERILFSDGGPPADAPVRATRDRLAETLTLWREGRLADAPDAADRAALLDAVLRGKSAQTPDAPAGLAELRTRFAALDAGLPPPRRGLAMCDGTGLNERVFIRGNPKNLGPEAPRRLPDAVAGPDQPAPASGSGRLELARRLTDPANPLVARVLVNRLWHHHFGAGIVRSPDDFGVQGERPTHPELLDWLAAEFVRGGWSIKHLHRLMVLSQTYRMASRPDAKADAADPQNKFLHRMPVRRLEAEEVRDAILTVSGRLDRTMFGPSVPPYLTPFMAGRGRPTASGPLDGDGRRTVYLNVRRNFLDPMQLAFDAPVPFTTIGRRGVSNVPAQALALMNNPFVVQQARLWAGRVLAAPGRSPKDRVGGMYARAFGRPPTAAELADALGFLADQAKEYGRPDDERAWADLAHVLFNVKGFVFVE